MSDAYLQVETTVSNRDDAQRIASALVERRLAACAQIIGPIRSLYRWEDEVKDDEEYLILLKTRQSLSSRLRDTLDSLHPYDVPEILFFSIVDGGRAYLDWVSNETRNA